MAYNAEKWAAVRADYESGKYTYESLHKKYGISVRCLIRKSVDNSWVKGKNQAIIENNIAQLNIAQFSALGMTREDVARKLINGTNCGDPLLVLKYLQEINKMTGAHAPTQHETALTGAGGKQLIPESYTKEDLKKEVLEMLKDK